MTPPFPQDYSFEMEPASCRRHVLMAGALRKDMGIERATHVVAAIPASALSSQKTKSKKLLEPIRD